MTCERLHRPRSYIQTRRQGRVREVPGQCGRQGLSTERRVAFGVAVERLGMFIELRIVRWSKYVHKWYERCDCGKNDRGETDL